MFYLGIIQVIKADMKTLMKEKDVQGLSATRLLVSELEKEKINLNVKTVDELTDEQVIEVVSRQIKKLNKEIDVYKELNKDVSKQEDELKLLSKYMPKQLSDDEILKYIQQSKKMVDEGIIKNPMQFLSKELKGKADMEKVSMMLKQS